MAMDNKIFLVIWVSKNLCSGYGNFYLLKCFYGFITSFENHLLTKKICDGPSHFHKIGHKFPQEINLTKEAMDSIMVGQKTQLLDGLNTSWIYPDPIF